MGWELRRRRFFSPFQPSLSFWLVPGSVVIVAIGMWVKSPNAGDWIYGITWRHVYFSILVLFNEDTTSILKLVFTTVYCFCLDGYVGGYVFAITNTIVVVFIYLFIYLFICLFVYLFIYLLFFWCFDFFSYFCQRCCHRHCCFCCWSHRCLVCMFDYCWC